MLPAARFPRTGLIAALLTIAACISLVYVKGQSKQRGADPTPHADPQANLMARYIIGIQRTMQLTGAWQPPFAASLKQAVQAQVVTPTDELRAEILSSALDNRALNADLLTDLARRAPVLGSDVEALTTGPTEAQWQELSRRHGWVAQVARAQASGWSDAHAADVTVQAQGTMFALAGAGFVGFLALIGGAVLLVFFIRRWRAGRLPRTLQPLPAEQAHSLIEGFAIYLLGYTVILSAIGHWFPDLPTPLYYGIALIFVLIALWWPRLRGLPQAVWRQTLGFHRGAGWWREMGVGVLGWLAALPLLFAAAWLGQWMARQSGTKISHPIMEDMLQPGLARWGLIALAVVWAPLVEETMFRGLLFPGLSARLRWLAGTLLSAFIFAIVHPQGLAGVPAIMVIAMMLSTLRLARSSLIAPMTAHALNNGLISAMLCLAA
jgi:membrane protease YdiL (CAAX protease family)